MKYIALILMALLQLLLSAVLNYKNRSKVSRMFIYFTATLLTWTIANIVLDYTFSTAGVFHDPAFRLSLLNWSNRIGFFIGTIVLISLYRLILVFPVEQKSTKVSKYITACGAIVALLALSTPVAGSYVLKDSNPLYQYGSLTIVIFLYFLVVAATSIRIMVRLSRHTTDRAIKAQTRTILTALLATAGLAIFIITILPVLVGNDSFIFYGYFSPFIFATALYYSIFRQKFLNFQTVVARSIGYILSITALVFSLSITTFVLVRLITGDRLTAVDSLIFIFISAIAAISYQPVKRFFDKVTNRLFYRDAYDAREAIDALNKVLVTSIDVDEVLKKSAIVIAEHLKLISCIFCIKPTQNTPKHVVGNIRNTLSDRDSNTLLEITLADSQKVRVTDALDNTDVSQKELLNANEISVLIKLLVHNDAIGFLAIGGKKSGNPLSTGDIQLLEIMANEIAIAVQNALRFEEIKNFAATLQEKVDNATLQLRRTNDKLKALDETKDEFISMASHQLRTPLTSVKGYMSMVIEGDAGKLSAAQKKLLDQAFASSQRMVYLIADLLNVSRLRTGKFIIEPANSNLADVVEGEVNQLVETAKGRKLTLTYAKPKDFPTMSLDETKIRQVIMNFIDNAIYYTPADGKIDVSLTDKGESVEFLVTDNGLGVPKADQHHLFSKFYRAGNARKARPDGTGLGLFMAKKVIIAQGGSLIFRSVEGKGSTFGFSFAKSKLKPQA